jgi:DNA adenine methylase
MAKARRNREEPRILPRPLLRWAGSKRQLLPQLKAMWSSDYERYIEPFAGSSCLFFEICPERAVLADKNSQLIEVYTVIRRTPKVVHAALQELPRNKATFYRLRAQRPTALRQLERVVRFLYLNRFCFNGLYRTNLRGEFNVPYSSGGTGDFPHLDHWIESGRQLRKAVLRAWDFGTTLRIVGKGDFVYIDPPFAVESRRVFVEYGPKLFRKDDLQRLANHLDKIDSRGATFLLSYANCREARDLFTKWHVRCVWVRRNIAGFEGARRRASELLVSNRAFPRVLSKASRSKT